MMNKGELIDTLVEASGVNKKDVTKVLDAFLKTVSASVKSGNAIQLVGFGTFKKVFKPERTARNPKTGESVNVAYKSVITFVPDKTLAQEVNQ